MVNLFLVVAMRSGGRDHLDEIIDDFDEADDDMKEFALHYAKDIVAQGRLKVFDRKLFAIQSVFETLTAVASPLTFAIGFCAGFYIVIMGES